MRADHKAKETEESKESKREFPSEPTGLPVHRKPVKDWSWKPLKDNYEILTQVGEGTFR